MTWFPGLRPSAAVRQLQVRAEALRVMEWLTDPDRREREWQKQVEVREDVQHSAVSHLPDGRMRFHRVVRQGNLLLQHTTEDIGIEQYTIERSHRARLAGPRMMPVRWVLNERITVESLADRTGITVSVQGRLAGIHRVLHVLGYRDTTTAHRLTQEASSRADFRVAGVAASFTGPHDADMSDGSAR